MSSNQKLSPFYFVIAGLLLLPVMGAFWFGFVSQDPLPFDSVWHDAINMEQGGLAYYLAIFFHLLGSTKGMAAVSFLILVVLTIMKKWWHAIALAATMLSVLVSSKVIKFLVDRPRPEDMLVLETETSFPSGHSLGAGAIATILVIFVVTAKKSGRSEKTLAILLGSAYILTMMWSRTALQVHWLSDTIAGALLGITLALLFTHIFLGRASRHSTDTGRHSIHNPKHTQ